MKRLWMVVLGCLLAGWVHAGVVVKQVDLTGTIAVDELALKMNFEADVEQLPARLMVLGGAVIPTEIVLPRGAEMVQEEGTYFLEFGKKGTQKVSIEFEAKVLTEGQRRAASFSVPEATIRQITLQTEKAGYKVEVGDVPQVQKIDDTHVKAFLPGTGLIRLGWSPELEKLSGELVASCDSILVGSAKVGALQLQGRYFYTLPQGRMKELSMKLPSGLNIIQVTGVDLLSWDVREQDGARQLLVELSRPHEKEYTLTIQAEQSLPAFPCSFDFPVIEPLGVIRANGVVLVGTDSTIKLLVDELGGLTQVEPDAVSWAGMDLPQRGLYAYMYANMPFNMKLSADNIVTALHAQDQLVLALSENDASLEARVDLEVRDAPAREVEVEVSKDWTVTGVSGQNVSDYDVRDREDSRWIKVYFKQAVDSRALLQVRLEKNLPEDASGFDMPLFRVDGARSERGFMVLRGDIGTRLEGTDLEGLREVNTGSLPVRIADARQAFRFKRSDWTGRVSIRKEQASIHAESFQLFSLGESGVFGSSLMTYNIANAPTRSFTLKIPSVYRNVEIHGRDIRNWTQDGERWTVHLQQKVIGDYTLLVTYDHPAKYQGEELAVGGVQTLEVENETGYIALAGAANLSLAEEIRFSPAVLSIDADEIPEEYALLVNDPIMQAYKYVAATHEAQVRIKRFATQPLLTQVADHITLNTTISKEGEAVTVAVYHVKNTDQQYLPIRLPELALLWTVKVNESKIQVLDQGDGQILVPVERHRDPNAPLKIEVTYAEQLNKPGLFGWMEFRSPQVDTQSVFAQWSFLLPEGKRLFAAKGNMEAPAALTGRRAVDFTKAVSGSEGELLVRLALANGAFEGVKNGLLLLAGLAPLIWVWVSRRRKWVPAALVVLTGVCSFVGSLAWVTMVLPLLFLVAVGVMVRKRKRSEKRRYAESKKELSAKEGFVQMKGLGVMLALAVAASVIAAPKADRVALQISVPEFETETRVNVAVHMEMELTAEKGDEFRIAGAGFILTGYELSSRHLSVVKAEEGTILRADRDGEYKVLIDYLVPGDYLEGEWLAQLWIPDALKNSAQVQLPVTGWNLQSPEAIRVRQEGDSADVLFDSRSRLCTLRWKPEERKTDREQARFFCDLNTLADFQPGMVGLRHDVRFNIAQGELQSLEFDVPAGMSITEVHGENIGTWRYDPESGLLEVVLSAPATESYAMQIGAQISREKLPYETTVKGIAVRNAVMQRGVVALAASAAVQIDITSTEELSGINISDAARLLAGSSEASIKRAFRYNQLPFAAQVSAEQVLPELRLSEETVVDVATEQIRLSSRLNVTVSKSGIFSLRIQIPEEFDVDSLSGDAVSHWDEVSTASKIKHEDSKSTKLGDLGVLSEAGVEKRKEEAGSRELVVNFVRQITGTIPLNLVLSRSGRDLDTEFTVPRIKINGVLKHTGSLVVTVERGIRLTPVVRDGVSEISPRELGIRQKGSLTYRLLRPDWKIELQSEVMNPTVKAEVLQRVALSEGLLKVRCYLQYDIEHAGVKTFRLQTPQPDLALVVSGRNVSRVRKIDEENGIWEVELHGKVEKRYGMEVAYQWPFAHDKSELTIRPLQTIGTDSQKGFVAVMSSGRLQVKPATVSEFLRPEDARSIPRRFGAGDLSDAVLCYRTTESDFELKLNVVRHKAADVLPAQVKSVRIDSVITKDDQSLNSLTMELEPGSLRFLEMQLPEGAEIWSVFVNETAVRPLVEDGLYLVPVEPGADLTAFVEVMYAQAGQKALFGGRHSFSGPQFKLPLTDVRWTFYAPEGYRYSRFDGTMQYERSGRGWSKFGGSFSEDAYYSYNADNSQRFGDSAKENIVLGNDLMQRGDQRRARKAFQKAISYSQGQQALNEDARVQFRNLVRQQGVVGLVNRRNQLKQSLNQVDVEAPLGIQTDVQKIEAQLGEKESSALSSLAEKMLDQQQAASVEVHPIRVVMARQGTQIEFTRPLQLQPNAEMKVEFHSTKTGGNRSAQAVAVLISASIILLIGRFGGIKF